MDAVIRKLAIAGLGVLGIGMGAAVQAAIIYSDPGLHVIDGLTRDDVVIEQGAQVAITGQGTVIGAGTATPDQRKAAMRVIRGNLTLQDNARVIAGHNQSAINMTSARADVRIGGNALVSGTIFSDGTTPGWRNEHTALQRLYLQDNAVVAGDLYYSGHLRIQDNALVTGRITNTANGSMGMTMTGGTIAGSISLGGMNDYQLDISGGSILGSLGGGPALIDLSMRGGHVAEGIRSQGAIRGDFSGGRIDAGIIIDDRVGGGANKLSFTGGAYDALADGWLLSLTNWDHGTHPSSIDIWGGEFGYQQSGLGFFLEDQVDFSIHGRDLVFADGWLSGYLQDGSWFNQAFTFGSNWQGAFNVHNVPEPGTLALLLMGALGCAVAGRRRVAGPAQTHLP